MGVKLAAQVLPKVNSLPKRTSFQIVPSTFLAEKSSFKSCFTTLVIPEFDRSLSLVSKKTKTKNL